MSETEIRPVRLYEECGSCIRERPEEGKLVTCALVKQTPNSFEDIPSKAYGQLCSQLLRKLELIDHIKTFKEKFPIRTLIGAVQRRALIFK